MAAAVVTPQLPGHHSTRHLRYESASSVGPPKQQTTYGGHLDTRSVSWMKPTPPDTPLSEVRRRLAEDGYVWMKHVIPRADVYDFREAYFSRLAPTGMLAPETTPRDGLFNTALDPSQHQGLGATPAQSAESLLDQIHNDERYRQFLAHPALRQKVREITGWSEEVLLKRGLIRHNVPGSKCPSGIHYDQLFLRAGDPVFVTAWVPIGDCAANGGGLMYLEDSCGLGRKIEADFQARQEREGMDPAERVNAFNRHMGELGHLSHDAAKWAQQDGKGMRWLVADYEAGDVVFHSPWQIHCSSQNEDANGRIRLATDLRFYEQGANLDARWTRPFFFGDGL